jgi:hypothetical protein
MAEEGDRNSVVDGERSGVPDRTPHGLSRRRVLAGSVAVGAATVWAVPLVEAITAGRAGAVSALVPPPTVSTNISWVDLVFSSTSGSTTTWCLWKGSSMSGSGWVSKLTGYGHGNISSSDFSSFRFYHDLGDLSGFSTELQDVLDISSSFDASGDLLFTVGEVGDAPSDLLLQYVIVHGGDKAYDGGTGSVVASDGLGTSPDSSSSPEELALAVPSSGVVSNDLQTATLSFSSGKSVLIDLSYVVGTTGQTQP